MDSLPTHDGVGITGRTFGINCQQFMRRSLSLPLRLAILVAGTSLPLIGFSAAIVYQHYRQDQHEAFGRVLQFTRGIQLVLDREMQGMLSGLTVLATADSLRRDDFEAFRARALAFLSQFPGDPSIVIADREGRLLFNSAMAANVQLPPRANRENRDEVFRTRKPSFSPLFVGSVSKRPIVTVTVPVFRGNEVVYDLSFDPPLEIFQRIIEQQKPNADWTISIFDQKGVNFARVPNPETTIGSSASPTLFAVMFKAAEGQDRTISLEGVPLLTAFVRSPLTGWTAAAGIAEKTLTAPAVRSFFLTGTIGIAMLAIGLGFAIRMARAVARAEALHDLLINEVNHRVKNTLATVQSLSSQTFRNGADPDARQKFDARLVSLGRAHDVLSAEKWESANITDVVNATMEPFTSAARDRIRVSGPAVALSSRSVVMLSMVLHELATNATKYGALSGPGGRVSIDWALEGGDKVALFWSEIGGPPVEKPDHAGFGSTLIEKGFAAQMGGSAALRFDSKGVSCALEFSTR
jgi:two-component sensor histidine kinase